MALWHDRTILPENCTEPQHPRHYGLDFSDKTQPDSNTCLGLIKTPWLSYRKIHIYSGSGEDEIIFVAIDGTVTRFYNYEAPPYKNVEDGLVGMIAHQYLKRGHEALFDLEGAATIILYDPRRKATIAYRALLNGHPLYYFSGGGRFMAASNPLYLFRNKEIDHSIDNGKIATLFALGPSSWPENVFTGINALEHGEMIVVTPERISKHRRTFAEFHLPISGKTDGEYIDGYKERLEDAIFKNLPATEDCGIMLSSGLDSSTIAALAAPELRKNDAALTAFSWELPNDDRGNEAKKISELCQYLNIPLKLFNGENLNGFDRLEDPYLVPHTPFVNPFWPMNDACYKHGSNHGVSFLLNGGFADLLFPGRRNLIRDAFREHRPGLAFTAFKQALARHGWSGLHKAEELRSLAPNFLKSLRKINVHREEYLSPNVYALVAGRVDILPEAEELDRPEQYRTLLCPFQASNPSIERLLTSRYDVQVISPHRDIELIKYCLAIPSFMTHRNGQCKYFAREAVRGMLPEAIRMQPRVGLLDNQLVMGLRRNIGIVSEILLSNKEIWSLYISPDWLQKKLIEVDKATPWDALILWICVNLCLWTKAIKPGGSLYNDA